MERTSDTDRPRRRPRAALLLSSTMALAVSVVLSGCSDAPGSSSSRGGSSSVGASAWGSCMRDAGFDIEDPSEAEWSSGVVRAPSGVDGDAFQRASASCRGDDAPRASDEQKAIWDQELRDFSACMREHGLDDFPEPEPESGLDYGKYAEEPLRDSPTVTQADEECSDRYLADWGTTG
ncbi:MULTISPECIES: hypothetical protein [unclassified Curtobacterium]|uniref:hypothetical protein n=1 Tax=unclassified Curtobacterium TaxID=257496 RepID=UPI0011B72C6D|nr:MULTISPECIES: hypothetical protein [unclassified Curtobacterium]